MKDAISCKRHLTVSSRSRLGNRICAKCSVAAVVPPRPVMSGRSLHVVQVVMEEDSYSNTFILYVYGVTTEARRNLTGSKYFGQRLREQVTRSCEGEKKTALFIVFEPRP